MKYMPIYTLLKIGTKYKIEKYDFVDDERHILQGVIYSDEQSAKDFCKEMNEEAYKELSDDELKNLLIK